MNSMRLFFSFLLAASGQTAGATLPGLIHSNAPALRWEDAMVTGNGLIGAMHYGPADKQITVFNCHKFIVPNGAPFPVPDMGDMVEPMRDMMLSGKVQEGYQLYYDELLRRRGMEPSIKRYYGMVGTQPFHAGYLMVTQLEHNGEVRDYRRATNSQKGLVVTRWRDDRGWWSTTSFASRTDDVLVTYIKAPPGAVVRADLSVDKVPKTPDNLAFETIVDEEFINVRARYPEVKGKQGGFEGVTQIIAERGAAEVVDQTVRIRGGDHLLLLTKLDRYRDDYRQWDARPLQAKLADLDLTFDELRRRHVAIHREMFDRVTFSLDAAGDFASETTEALLQQEEADKQNVNHALVEKLFSASRYLFMASSGEQYAPRLSGMFSGEWRSAWAGDYTCDANVNLAVMGGNIADLPQCMEGYFRVLERSLPQWREGAEKLYGCRGILGPVRIDGEVAFPLHAGPYHAHFTATGLGPWLVYPMYEHYLVTGDKAFLRDRLHPLLKELALFYEDFLKRTDNQGDYVFVPSNSPENSPMKEEPKTSATINSTMDIAAAKHALRMLLFAEEELGVAKAEQTRKYRAMLSKMPPYLLTDDGALKEWSWPTLAEHYGHRHSSHMYPVWPAYEVSLDNPETAELVPAIVKALEKRKTGLVQAHDALQKAAAWLRVKKPEEFYRILKHLLEQKYLYNSLATAHNKNHDIYNYDAILCLQGLLIEMCVYTDSGVNAIDGKGVIELLPALPSAFRTGRITGVKGRNRTTIDYLKWDQDAREIRCRISSDIDQTLVLIHRGGIKSLSAAASASPLGNHAREVTFAAGKPLELVVTH